MGKMLCSLVPSLLPIAILTFNKIMAGGGLQTRLDVMRYELYNEIAL